ncbi:MAG: WD40 repeat domain-containing protein, partial [Pirellulales bacterium]
QGGVWESETGRLLARFRDLPQTPYALAASPNGRLAAIGFRVSKRRDNRWDDPDAPGIWLYDVESGRVVRKFRGHTGMVNAVAFSADGRFLVSGSGGRHAGEGFVQAWDNSLRVWNVETGAEMARAPVETEWGVCALALLPDGRHVVTGSGDDGQPDLRLWQLPESVWPNDKTEKNELTEVRRYEGHAEHVFSLAVSGDGKLLVSGSADGTARVWDMATRRVLQTFQGKRKEGQMGAAISRDGERVATGHRDGMLRIWDRSTEKLLAQAEAHPGGFYHVEYSPDGSKLLTTACDNTARIWDGATGEKLASLSGHTGWVNHGAFFPDGRKVVTTSFDRTVRVWDVDKSSEALQLPTGQTISRAVDVSADGTTVAVGFRDGSIRLFDPDKGVETHRLSGHTDRVRKVVFTPDGRHLISGSYDRTLRIWNLESGTERARMTDKHHIFNTLAVTPDGRHVLSAGGVWKPDVEKDEWVPELDYAIRLWRLPPDMWPQETSKPRPFDTNHLEPITSVDIAPNGRYVLSSSNDKTARLTDVSGGNEVRAFLGHGKTTGDVAFSHDGDLAVSACDDGILRLWNVETGDLIQELKGHTGWIRTVCFSPDGKYILSGSADYSPETEKRDRSLRLWDAKTGKEIRRFEEIDNAVNAAAFTSDGRYVVAAGEWRMVGLWEVETGKRIRKFATPDTHAISLAISPNGKTAATGHVAKDPT